MSKISGKPWLGNILQDIWPVQNCQSFKNKENLRNYSQEEPKETWLLNLIQGIGWDLGTKTFHIGKKLENLYGINKNVSILIY